MTPGTLTPKSHPLFGIFIFTFGLLLSVSFADYTPEQSRWITTAALHPQDTPSNLVGTFGDTASFFTSYTLGFAKWLIPIYLFWSAFVISFRRTHLLTKGRGLTMLIALISTCGLLSLIHSYALNPGALNFNAFPNGLGGFIGYSLFNRFLEQTLGLFGSGFLLTITSFLSLTLSLSFKTSPRATLESIQHTLFPSLSKAPKGLFAILQNAKNSLSQKLAASREARAHAKQIAAIESPTPPKPKTNSVPIIKEDPQPAEPKAIPTTPISRNPSPASNKGLKIIASEEVEKASINLPQRRGNFIFPSQDLLTQGSESEGMTPEEHQDVMDQLVKTLAEFGVSVLPGEVHTGPVITRYEVTPAPGVRVEKIVNLDKNIALSLRAHSIRILAPVPGKAAVGIEIPNKTPSPVCLRDIIESKAWSDSNAEIPIVLGKEVTGKPVVFDLTKMPHLLIAGSTGSGKTVCINAIIASLLYHSSPADLRFIMIDPKIVEMQAYNALPHMLIPVVTDPKKVPGALKWLIAEMEHRYQIFAAVGARNIAGFNAKALKNKSDFEKAEELDAELSPEERAAVRDLEVPRDADIEIPKEKLPYIVCIVDELADLMLVAPADIETGIARLAQLARAAGIHLILATQRPSVNVITGVIKANLPSRIAFKVASKVDSRTILDGGGADQLIGRGDMLFIPPGTSNLMRAQGAYVSDNEINDIIEAIKVNGPPEYAVEVQRQIETSDSAGVGAPEGGWSDDLIPAALEVINNSKRASTSMLQRRLRIGYNRAARIMELLEQEGYVGPENGQSPREILRDLDHV